MEDDFYTEHSLCNALLHPTSFSSDACVKARRLHPEAFKKGFLSSIPDDVSLRLMVEMQICKDFGYVLINPVVASFVPRVVASTTTPTIKPSAPTLDTSSMSTPAQVPSLPPKLEPSSNVVLTSPIVTKKKKEITKTRIVKGVKYVRLRRFG